MPSACIFTVTPSFELLPTIYDAVYDTTLIADVTDIILRTFWQKRSLAFMLFGSAKQTEFNILFALWITLINLILSESGA